MSNLIPRGQISTILLGCLVDGDKYGAQLLTQLSELNSFSIKQPTLYSTLSRMEKQGLISSYWRDSEVGGKRHYYSLTDLGKKTLLDAKNTILAEIDQTKYDEIEGFEKNNDKLFTQSNSSQTEFTETNSFFENLQNNSPMSSKDDGVFLKPDEVYIIPNISKTEEKNMTKSKVLQNQNEIAPEETIQDGGVFITESLPKENIPKVKKLDAVNLQIKRDNDISLKINRPEHPQNYQDKIEDLYQKTRANNLAKTYQAEIPEFSTTQELQKRYDDMQIKFYAKSENNKEISNDFGKIPTSKLFAKYFTIFLLILFESLTVWLTFYLVFSNVPYALAYVAMPVIFAIFPLYFLTSKNKYKKIHRQNGAIWIGILLFVVGTMVIYSLNLFLGISFQTIILYPTTFIYPCILLSNFVVAGIFDSVYSKKYS